MAKGSGVSQRILRRLSEIQIIFALLHRPYTYDELFDVTGVNRKTLSEIKESFVNDGLIVKHELNLNKTFLQENLKYRSLMDKNGCKYYLADLNNKIVLRYIADPLPLALRDPMDYGISAKYKKLVSNKLKRIPEDIDSYFLDIPYKIFEDAEYEAREKFHVKEEYLAFITSSSTFNIKKTNTLNEDRGGGSRSFESIKKEVKKHKEEYEHRLKGMMFELKQLLPSELEEFRKNDDYSKWNFLISVCCNDTDRKYTDTPFWYKAIWNTLDQYEHKISE